MFGNFSKLVALFFFLFLFHYQKYASILVILVRTDNQNTKIFKIIFFKNFFFKNKTKQMHQKKLITSSKILRLNQSQLKQNCHKRARKIFYGYVVANGL